MRIVIMACCLALLHASPQVLAQPQAPTFEWVRPAGGPSNDRAADVGIGPGNIAYVTGGATYDADFVDTTVTAEFVDAFLARYGQDGTIKWLRIDGGAGNDQGRAIAADSFGFVYTTGFFEQTAYFDNDSLVSQGRHDIFVAKYATNGDFVWARRAGGIHHDEGQAIAVSPNGDRIAVTGFFAGTADFEGIQLSTSEYSDVFVAVYDSDGSLVWVRQAGAAGINEEEGTAVSFLSDGSVVVAGVFEDEATFGTLQLVGVDDEESFVARYLSNGDVDWVVHISGTNDENIHDIDIDDDDRIFITGGFAQTLVLESTTLTAAETVGNDDVFVGALAADGSMLWLKQAGGEARQTARSVTARFDGHVVIAGDFQGELAFPDYTFTPEGGATDLFVADYSSDGEYRWARQASGPGIPRAFAVEADSWGELYVVGQYSGEATFDDITIVDINSLEDIFVAKLGSVVGIAREPATPRSGALAVSVYPNPFRTTATLTLDLPRSGVVDVALYDATGRRIAEATRVENVPGQNSVTLSGAGLSAGVYFVRVNTGEETATIPVTRVR